MAEKLDADEKDFLTRVRDGRPLRPAYRDEDRLRQRMRKAGLAEVLTNPRRWASVTAGSAALEKARTE